VNSVVIDKMMIEILPDGTIKTMTESFVSKPNHDSAEAFLKNVALLAGGKTERVKLAGPRRRLEAGNSAGRAEVKA
jgi:hypothetical protein